MLCISAVRYHAWLGPALARLQQGWLIYCTGGKHPCVSRAGAGHCLVNENCIAAALGGQSPARGLICLVLAKHMIRRQSLPPNVSFWRLRGNGGISPLFFKEEGLQCRFWYLTHDSMARWYCPFSASSAAQLSPNYTILAWGILGCTPG